MERFEKKIENKRMFEQIDRMLKLIDLKDHVYVYNKGIGIRDGYLYATNGKYLLKVKAIDQEFLADVPKGIYCLNGTWLVLNDERCIDYEKVIPSLDNAKTYRMESVEPGFLLSGIASITGMPLNEKAIISDKIMKFENLSSKNKQTVFVSTRKGCQAVRITFDSGDTYVAMSMSFTYSEVSNLEVA